MSEDQANKARAVADGVLALAAELEASGEATTGGSDLAGARAILHEWINTVTGVIALPAFGRVTLVHADGSKTTISSPELSYRVSKPVTWAKEPS